MAMAIAATWNKKSKSRGESSTRAKKSDSSGGDNGDGEEVGSMPVSTRESLLVEAWERRKRGLLHQRQQRLSRSSSDSVADQLMFITGSSSSHGSLFSSENGRARSLTDDDFEELRGCIDLGFRFHHSSISDLCNTLPALHVCSAISQTQHEPSSGSSPFSSSFSSMAMASSSSFSSSPDGFQPSPSVTRSSSWTISSPGDDPKAVKGRLRHWAQAVACNIKLFY